MMQFRVIVAGDRNFSDYALMVRVLDKVLANRRLTHDVVIVSGMARGADTLGERYAREHGLSVQQFPAQWDVYGKSAGPRRNLQMLEVADALVAFWRGPESRGTSHMIRVSQAKGIPVRVIRVVIA